jgi:hypothetical protein
MGNGLRRGNSARVDPIGCDRRVCGHMAIRWRRAFGPERRRIITMIFGVEANKK